MSAPVISTCPACGSSAAVADGVGTCTRPSCRWTGPLFDTHEPAEDFAVGAQRVRIQPLSTVEFGWVIYAADDDDLVDYVRGKAPTRDDAWRSVVTILTPFSLAVA